MPKVVRQTMITTKVGLSFSGHEVFEALRARFPGDLRIPPEAPNSVGFKIWVDVPTGGDYSGTRLEIDMESPLQIQLEWTIGERS